MTISSEIFDGNYFTISIPDLTEDILIRSIRRPQLSYGADNIDNESIFFPSNVKIEFFCLYNLLPLLCNKDITISIFENNTLVFKGYLDVEDINYSPLKNIYSLRFIDQSDKLKRLKYNQSVGYTSQNWTKKLDDLFLEALGVLDYVQLIFKNEYAIKGEVTNYYPGGSSYLAPFSQFCTSRLNFYDSRYDNLWDVIKGILDSFCLLGYFSAGKFIVTPRFADNVNYIVTEPEYDLSNTEYEMISKYDAVSIKWREYFGNGTYGDAGMDFYYGVDDGTKKNNFTYNFAIPELPNPNYNPDYATTGWGDPYDTLYEVYAMAPNNGLYYVGHKIIIGNNQPERHMFACGLALKDKLTRFRKKVKTTVFREVSLFDNICLGTDPTVYKITSIKKEIGTLKFDITAIEV
jgi:hypothetical protein